MEALTPEMMIVLAILVAAIILFVTEIVRIDVAAIIIMVAVGLTGLVGPKDLFSGFSSNAVISIIAVMILGAGLDRVGVMHRVAAFLLKIGGHTEARITALLSGSVASISAFMQNIGAAALFLPVAERLSERTKIPVSKLLMPMGFAAILGGTMTLVASGPLILLNDLLASSASSMGIEIEPFGLFAPTPIGIALTVSGILLFIIFGSKLLPAVQKGMDSRHTIPDVTEIYGLNQNIHAFYVPGQCALDKSCVEAIESQRHGVLLAAIQDDQGVTVAPYRDYPIKTGAIIGLVGDAADIDQFAAKYQLKSAEVNPFEFLHDVTHAGLVEVLVRPGSEIDGKIVRSLTLRETYGVALLGIYRSGTLITENLRQTVLQAGDVLVVFSSWDKLKALNTLPSFVVLSDYPAELPLADKLWWGLGAFALSLGLVIFSDMQLSLALMVGAVILLISKVLTADEAYRAVSWKTVFLLAALIPLGQAMEDTGTAAWIAGGVIAAAQGFPAWGIQLTVAVLTTVFTLTISNVGATVLLVPLAANVAMGVGADPAQYGLIVAMAASNAFLLPTHQVNALLMGPGQYRVKDFLKAGTAMTVVFLIVLIVSINLFI